MSKILDRKLLEQLLKLSALKVTNITSYEEKIQSVFSFIEKLENYKPLFGNKEVFFYPWLLDRKIEELLLDGKDEDINNGVVYIKQLPTINSFVVFPLK